MRFKKKRKRKNKDLDGWRRHWHGGDLGGAGDGSHWHAMCSRIFGNVSTTSSTMRVIHRVGDRDSGTGGESQCLRDPRTWGNLHFLKYGAALSALALGSRVQCVECFVALLLRGSIASGRAARPRTHRDSYGCHIRSSCALMA